MRHPHSRRYQPHDVGGRFISSHNADTMLLGRNSEHYKTGKLHLANFFSTFQPIDDVGTMPEIWLKSGHNDFLPVTKFDAKTGDFECWKTELKTKDSKSRTRTQFIKNGFDYIWMETQKPGTWNKKTKSYDKHTGVFYMPNPGSLPLADSVTMTDRLVLELDNKNGTKADQIWFWDYIEKILGIKFAIRIHSGGKSEHVTILFDKYYPIELVTQIKDLFYTVTGADHTLRRYHQVCRTTGFYRADKDAMQVLDYCNPDNRYSLDYVWDALKKLYDANDLPFYPDITSNGYFTDRIQRILAKKVDGEALPWDEKLKLIREVLQESPEAWQERCKVERAAAAVRAAEARKRFENDEREGKVDYVGLVKQSNRTAEPCDFNKFDHEWVQGGRTFRGSCPWHSSSSGKSAYLFEDKKNGGWRFSCGTCFSSDSLTHSQYCLYASRGLHSSFGRGFEFIKNAHGYLTRDCGLSLPALDELQYRSRSTGFDNSEEKKKLSKASPIEDEYTAIVAQQQEQERCDEAEAEHLDSLGFLENLFRLGNRKKKRSRGRVNPINSEGYLIRYSSQDQRNSLIAQKISKGWKHIVDCTDTGGGKSHYTGLLEADQLESEKILYFCAEPDNPSTKTVEANFDRMPIRHQGMEFNGKYKPLGDRVMRPTPFDRSIPTAGNCRLAHLFVKLGGLGYNSEEEAKSNPLCQGCEHNKPRSGEKTSECAAHTGPGFGHRKERWEAFQNDRLRLHPNSAPAKLNEDTVAVWEEFGALATPKRLSATVAELETEWAALEQNHPEAYSRLADVRRALRSALVNPEHWGTKTEKIREQFEALPDAVELLEQIKTELKQSVADLFGGKHKSLRERTQQAKQAKRNFERSFKRAVKLDGEIKKLVGAKQTVKRAAKLAAKQTQLERERAALEVAGAEHFSSDDELAVEQSSRRSKVDAEHVVANARSQKLWDLLSVLLGVQPGAIRVHRGKAEITLPNERIRTLMESAKANIILDATINPAVLAATLGVDLSEILFIKLDQPKAKNQTHIQVSGFGKCKRDRAESTNQRLAKLHDGIKQDAARRLGTDDFQFEAADYKGVEAFDAKIRHLSNSRGSNEITGAQVLVVHGLPKPNQGAVEDEYACLINPPFTFEQYYQYRCDVEIEQLAGRQRADRFPDQLFLIYWVNEDSLPFEAEQVQAGNLAIEAAPFGEQVWQQVESIVKDTLRKVKIFPTLKFVADQIVMPDRIGCSVAYISSLAERFAGSWKNLKRIGWTLLKPPDPGEQELTEVEATAIEQLIEITLHQNTGFIEAFSKIAVPLGWSRWLRVVSRLSRDIRIGILLKLIQPFSVEVGSA